MKKIYVGNLPYRITEEELQTAFAVFGAIEKIDLIIDRYTGNSKGFGFISFDSQAAAQEAIKNMDGKELKGRKLKVSIAREKTGGDDRGGDRRRFG